MGHFSAKKELEAQLEIAKLQLQAAKEQAQLQYDAANKQIEAQREANAQQQEFNKNESELAFQRSSSKGQLAQLKAAGLSEAQAMQIIAGGATGGYTPASSVNQMQGVDLTAPAQAQASAIQAQANADTQTIQANTQYQTEMWNGSILGAIDYAFNVAPGEIAKSMVNIPANLLASSLGASNGGVIGNMQTAPLQSTILQHLNELPSTARGSYAGFCSFANSSEAPAWMHTPEFQTAMQSATKTPMAMRAIQDWFNRDNELLTGDTYFDQDRLDLAMKAAANKIASFKVDITKNERDLNDIEQDYKIAILPDRYSAMLTTFQQEAAHMATERDLWENEEYKKQYILQKLKSTEDAAIMAKVMTLKHLGAFNHLSDHPELAQMFGIYQMWSDVGMTDDLFGEVVASIDAVGESSLGFGVADILKSVKEWIDTKKNKKGIF